MIKKLKTPSSFIGLSILISSYTAFSNTSEPTLKVLNLSAITSDIYHLQSRLVRKNIETVECVSWGKQCDKTNVCCSNLVCTDGICLEYVNPR